MVTPTQSPLHTFKDGNLSLSVSHLENNLSSWKIAQLRYQFYMLKNIYKVFASAYSSSFLIALFYSFNCSVREIKEWIFIPVIFLIKIGFPVSLSLPFILFFQKDVKNRQKERNELLKCCLHTYMKQLQAKSFNSLNKS